MLNDRPWGAGFVDVLLAVSPIPYASSNSEAVCDGLVLRVLIPAISWRLGRLVTYTGRRVRSARRISHERISVDRRRGWGRSWSTTGRHCRSRSRLARVNTITKIDLLT